jgi:hypothetical protein
MKIPLPDGTYANWRDAVLLFAIFGLLLSVYYSVQKGEYLAFFIGSAIFIIWASLVQLGRGEYLAFFIGSAIFIIWASLVQLGREKGILGYTKEAS